MVSVCDVLFVVVVFLLTHHASCDVRCKCICPKEPGVNTTNIFVNNNLTSSDECQCSLIVGREETFCLKCECKYETRNTLLIKVIVIFVLAGISALYIYMAFVVVQTRRTKPTLSVTSDDTQEQYKRNASRRGLSISSLDRRMTVWQQQLDEQRNNVYGANNVLN